MTLSTGAHTSKPCSPLRRARLVYHACVAANCVVCPPELEIVGITRYREIHAHPWRIIYEAFDAMVHVQWVFDSRRDVAGQFAQKMLR